jgi:hypothetical protein
LRMENELLAFEVRFLRSRLGQPAKIPGSSTSMNRLAYLEEAERDLVLLLRRMSASPLAPLLRRNKNFRTLEYRYLLSSQPRSSFSSPERLAYLEEAERDLVLLLRRMSASPLRRVLRRRKSFRTLQQRYL